MSFRCSNVDNPSRLSNGIRRGRIMLLSVFLFALTIAYYLPVTRFGFVTMDDTVYITRNALVKGGLSAKGVFEALTTLRQGFYIPLTWLSFMADVELHGLSPGWMHFTNTVVHAASAVLLLGLLAAMTGAPGRSFLVAGCFALHPLHVESVAWITERKDVLFAFFLWASLLAHLRWVNNRARTARWISLILYICSLASKPMMVTLPMLLLVLDWWPLGRLRIKSDLPPLLREKIPHAVIALAFGLLTVRPGGVLTSLSSLPLGKRLALAGLSYGTYLRQTFWPTDLAKEEIRILIHQGFPMTQVAAGGAAIAGLTTLAYLLRRRFPALGAGWLWFAVSILPVSGLMHNGDAARGDRFTYVPLVGIYLALAKLMPDRSGRCYRLLTAAAIAGILLALGAVSRHQLEFWRDDVTFERHRVDVNPGNWTARINLAVALGRRGDDIGAEKQLRAALTVQPNLADIWYNLGISLSRLGKNDEALAAFSEALRLDPGDLDSRGALEKLREDTKEMSSGSMQLTK